MKTIIAPTDFSDVSVNAVNYAADMAKELNAELLIIHATEFDVMKFSTESDCAENIEEKFYTLKQSLLERTENKIKIRSKQVSGIIENEMLKICGYKDPFAVVMATHGVSFREYFFVGSITVHLSRTLKYPVIVIPQHLQFKPIQKIVLTTDLREIDQLPLEKISSVVKAFNAKLHVLHVMHDSKPDYDSAEVKALENNLKHLNPVFHFLRGKNVQQGILCFAENNNIDMILTFPKKHSLFHNSESRQLIFNSPVSVMTLQ